MKRIILIQLILYISTFNLEAQSIKRHVLGSLGSFQQSTNLKVNTTFGQPPNAGTIKNSNNYLRQGFQQPICLYNPQAVINAINDTQCIQGNTFTFNYPLQVDSYTNFIWSFGQDATPNTSSVKNPQSITYSTTGTKTITLIVKRGACKDTAYQKVFLKPSPTITGISVSNDSLCYGDSTVLTSNINPAGAIVTWWDSLTGGNNLGTGNTLNTGGLKKITTYYAQVVSSNGCGSLQTRTAATVYVEPINSITLISDKPNNIFATGETVTFTASPSGYSRYDFYVRNILVQTGTSAIYSSATLSDNDTVSVRATNNGCATLKAEVVVHGGEFPNAFTPNGDGKNDLYLKGYDLTILNRWGQELFTGTGGWDGSYNGQRVSPGTYFYIVKLNNKLIKGTVAVIEQ